MAAAAESKENNGDGLLRKRRSSAELGAPTAGSKQDAPKRFRRKSIEQLIATEGSLRIRVARGKKGFGFNLRGTTGVSGAKRQRGQYVRSVDFGSPAHEAGLRAGHRILAVNGQQCDDREHEWVIQLVKSSPGCQVELEVVADSSMGEHARKVTESLLQEQHDNVVHDDTGIPHFTVEMTDASLGRTKMIQDRLMGGVTNCPSSTTDVDVDDDGSLWC